MAKQIRRSDIAEEDIFKSIRESAEQTISVIEKLNVEFKGAGEALKQSVGGAKFDSAKSINEFTKAVQKANQLTKEAIKLEQELEKQRSLKAKADAEVERAANQRLKTEQQAIRTAETKRKADEAAAKAAARATKAALDEANAYKQLEKSTREAKNAAKTYSVELANLEASGKRFTKEWRDVRNKLNEATKAAREGDAALKKIDASVGDNFRNVGNYTGAINKLTNGLSQLGLAFGIGSVVTSVGRTVMEFDQAIADLVSITGAGGKDLEFFKQQSIELGKEVEGGASAVIEAYKLIGSAKPELLSNAEALNEVTKAAMTLSQASGMALPDAATALTDAMNQFGAPAEDAARFIDALANGALFGSAEIPQVTEALLKFGAVANTANVSLEESTGLIEALAEKGLKGAEAGTALRNVMLKLSAPDALPEEAKKRLEELGISFAELQDTSRPFSARLKSLKPLLKDNAALVKVFGTENAVAATNLISQTDRIEELTKQMHTQGTASKQAEDRTQTLSHALTQLKGAWDELILSFTEGSGAGSALTGFISFLADNLGTIIGLVAKATVVWGAYKAMQMSLVAIEKIRSFSLGNMIKNMASQIPLTKAYKQAQLDAGKASMEMGKSAQTAGRAMNAIPWLAIISAAIELATAFYDIASGARAAREAQEKFDKSSAEGQKKAEERISKRQENLQKEIAALERLRNQNPKKEAEFLKRKQELLRLTQKQIQEDIKTVNERKKQYNEELKIAAAIGAKIKKQGDATTLNKEEIQFLKDRNAYFNVDKNYQDVIADLKANIGGANAKIKEYRKELDQVNESTKDATSEVKVNSQQHEDNTQKINAKIPKMRELNVEMDKYNDYLSIQNELLATLEQQRTEQQIEDLTDKISELTDEAQFLADQGIKPDLTEIEKAMQERYDLEQKLIQQTLDAQLAAIDKRYDEESARAKERLTENYQKLISQEGLTAEQRAQIEKQYQDQLDLFAKDEVERNADKETEKTIAKEAADYERIQLEKKTNQDIVDLKNEVNDKLLKIDEEKATKDEENAEALIEKERESAQRRIDIANMLTDAAIKASDRRLELIQKEIDAATKQADILRDLAAQGNIDAKESLAVQEELIRKANIEREKELRRQQRIKLASSVYTTYQSKLEKGEQNPLASTIRDTVLLQQFINTLPTFLEGTEDTGTNGKGVDGKGGFHAILHPNERVLTKEHNKMVGDLTNEELAKVAQEYQNGRILNKYEGAEQIGNGWNTLAVIKKLDDLEKAIKNKPETNIELAGIVQGAIDIVETTKKGNSIIYNKHRVRK